ncbi:MAG: leucine-rich repeat domain-containing protein [Verrucomicrobiota bacterium]|nr:leucine-rich repeat domain-containing protein [Verrucomicrobiota bacterium]
MSFKSLIALPLLLTALQAASEDDLTFTPNGSTEYSVVSIGSSAFFGCSGLTSITIPDSVSLIGASAFRNCSGLTSIIIPDSVTSIGSSAFANCTNLASAQFDGYAPSIGSQVFDNTQVFYTVVSATNAASYGGDGATYGDLIVVDYSEIATGQYLYTQSEYDAKLFIEEVQDLRAGSTMIEIENGQAALSLEVEESSDLAIWTNGAVSTIQIPLDAEAGKKFFRFKMTD